MLIRDLKLVAAFLAMFGLAVGLTAPTAFAGQVETAMSSQDSDQYPTLEDLNNLDFDD